MFGTPADRHRIAPPRAPGPADARHLRIGGLVPLTTLDYPGELAAVVFLQGCPWRCRYCQNGALLDPRASPLIDWSEVRALLERRRGLLDAVVFSGGEPSLQAALPAALREVRALGFKVGLHTAGPSPRRLARLLPLLDWVALDIKALPSEYPSVTGLPRSGEAAWESLARLLASEVPLEVRTTALPGWTPADIQALTRAIADAGVRNYALQACDTRHLLDATLIPSPIPFAELAAAIDPDAFDRLTLRNR